MEAAELTASAVEAVAAFFEILGWDLKPTPPFSDCPEPLGTVLDLRDAPQGLSLMKTKPKRIAEIVCVLDAILSEGSADAAALRSLRWRLLHARAQSFGRFGGAALSALGAFADCGSGHAPLPPGCRAALGAFRSFLFASRPRGI